MNLSAALRELGVRVHTESVPEGLAFDISAPALARSEPWNLVTTAGRPDVVLQPSGTKGYDDPRRTAVRHEVFGVELFAAALRDIVRSKQAAGRPQDRQDVALMREMPRKQIPRKRRKS